MQIQFEIHITVTDLPATTEDSFITFCTTNNAKPLIIELAAGDVIKQPMLSQTLYAEQLNNALEHAHELSSKLQASGFVTNRIKIETPAIAAQYFEDNETDATHYFEWHGKVKFERPEQLLAICKLHNAHLSKNTLKNDDTQRYVTIREYESYNIFCIRRDLLISGLQNNGWQVSKQQSEYCAYDSNTAIDNGWLPELKPRLINIDNSVLPELKPTPISKDQHLVMLACEAFIRRAAEVNGRFMLKGSYVTRQYLPEQIDRIPGDLDWVYLEYIKDPAQAGKIFNEWAIAVTECEIFDGVEFVSFEENAFWRMIDYAMDDDFPTVNTDLECIINGQEVYFHIDISFNLPVEQPPVSLNYKPLHGDEFVIPQTTPISTQVAWKMHQTLIRARFKDILDLTYLVKHSTYNQQELEKTMQTLINELAYDGNEPHVVELILSPDFTQLFGSDVELGWQWWRHETRDPGINITLYESRAPYVANTDQIPKLLNEFEEQFKQALSSAGFSLHLMDRLPQPAVSEKKREFIKKKPFDVWEKNDSNDWNKSVEEQTATEKSWLQKLFNVLKS